MILVVSPAKTLDYSESTVSEFTQPRMLPQSEKLIGQLKKKSVKSLKKLMNISDQLAELNAERYHSFSTPFTQENAKQSILAFKGDVYTGLQADDFDENDLHFAQKHLRILSGLYGLLRPLDLMQAYRLEMGTSLKVRSAKNLYQFWDDQITGLLNEDLKGMEQPVVVNLASREYFSAIRPDKLAGEVVEVQFKELRNESYKVIAFFAKKARGMMCRFAIKNRLENPAQLKQFSEEGYQYNESLSEPGKLVFTREQP
jgi:hypothetical protein